MSQTKQMLFVLSIICIAIGGIVSLLNNFKNVLGCILLFGGLFLCGTIFFMNNYKVIQAKIKQIRRGGI